MNTLAKIVMIIFIVMVVKHIMNMAQALRIVIKYIVMIVLMKIQVLVSNAIIHMIMKIVK